MPATRPRLPKLSAIANYWSGMPRLVCADVFPQFWQWCADWDDPFCFRCGWKAPVECGTGWDHASGWLERAHLVDRELGGPDAVENLVPLCPLCHEDMPRCRVAGEAFTYVSSVPISRDIRWYFQMFTNEQFADCPRPGKSALHKLMRAQAAVGALVASALIADAAPAGV